ncbi:MAG: dTDP-4-dehydrorhamnose 3,5-epimerase [Chloroflexota bacterium]
MNVVPTPLPGLFVIEPRAFQDARGWFLESFNERAFGAAGLNATMVQANHSHSRLGTVRGLHFQNPNPQIKLVRVVQGEVFDVVVDVRRGSPTFGRSFSVTLSAANRRQLWVPVGFAHGFCVTSDAADFTYMCSDFYAPATERGIRWDDPALQIAWPTIAGNGEALVVSPKDQALPTLAEVLASDPDHLPEWVESTG